ncbi:hypothetical protein IOC51_06630 [Vibrio parahaemolyticus]|uniref:hypothetical protein n=1 Tax=Vibrio parahaemolyticus TaxID=670 RepID=UPI001E6304AF|nr:hypothetical protein [Vibrio parahaemolyticus]MCD1413710.1 hypothetical protein [Vibrio parahaemolyticus]
MNYSHSLVVAIAAALSLSGCATEAQMRYKQERLERDQRINQTLNDGGRCIFSSGRFAAKDMVLRMSHIKKYVDGMWVETNFDGQFLTVVFDYSDMLKFDVAKKGAITRNNRYVFLETNDGDYGVYALTDYASSCATGLDIDGLLFSPNDLKHLHEHNVL